MVASENVPSTDSNQESMLAIRDLRFRWPKSQQDVLDIQTLDIKKGDRVFIKGQSGTGKTTLLSLIGGIHTPTAGKIQVLNQNIHALNPAKRDQFRADHIGFIFQLFNLIPYLSVIDNVILSCQFSTYRHQRVLNKGCSLEEEALRLLAHLHLNDEALLAKPVVDLSVGQQQRVATARALIGAPQLIIADEPTSALDTDTRERFIQLLFQECKACGSTLLFVSHDGQLQTLFDQTIMLEDINRCSSSLAEAMS